ncbi:hypothetical protein BB561_006107 [Smittium simulii]|uniref:W2 domain-containing protein n=1 Tax=Smittium simulii TaxID=133385 RepID=A0A2T9Y6J6_9FUNG|nr:hypothetical protein BB561_006107 [Smittium simulii]
MSTQNIPKPSLNGANIKIRKRVNKANAKFEPETFRNSIFELVKDITDSNLDQISNKLDSAGNSLDYRKYGETFFELLVSGGLIAPGGIIEYDEEFGEISFSLFKLSNPEDPLPGAIAWVNLISKLTRRYKYLEKIFSETSTNIVEYINRYSEENNKKLATGFGLLYAEGLMSTDAIKTLQKEHLVKDGYALQFFTMLLRAYLKKQHVQNFFSILSRNRVELIDYFPFNKRTDEYFIRHFDSEDMHDIIKYKKDRQVVEFRDLLMQQIADIIGSEGDRKPIVIIIWDAIFSNIKWGVRSEVIEQQTFSSVKDYSILLASFTTSPKSEMALLKHIQLYCYEDAKLMRIFTQIIRILYEEDVLSYDAIVFWSTKGALPQGKSTFLKQMEKFLAVLESLEDESDEDQDSDEE